MASKKNETRARKIDHLKFATSVLSQVGNPGFDRYRFVHNALPEINFDKVDPSTVFLNKKVDYPFFISCMTGGIIQGEKINRNLAMAAQKYKIPMGVGSQRAAIENPNLRKLFQVRKYAPDVPIIANVGLVQLNYGFSLKHFQETVRMIEADALAVHLNPIQEVIQPEGDRNFSSLLPKLAKIVAKLKVPVIVKEVGFGLSDTVVKRLYSIGIKIFDTAGWGGTNWAFIEGMRGKADIELGKLFSNWGIPTTDSILQTAKFKAEVKDTDIVILGSGGVRTEVDIAKTLALGADLAGIAMPFTKAAIKSQEEVEKLITRLASELRVSMFGVGAKNLEELKKAELIPN